MEKNFKKPNVLVAGFPKCGSTYFYHLLKQHPDIFIPKIKELNYFNKDNFFLSDPEILNPRYFKNTDWYFSFFETDKKIVVDFSILSALDVSSAKRVRELLGDVKIIFITRNKKDFIESVNKFMEKEGEVYKDSKKYSDFEYYMGFYEGLFSKIHLLTLENLKKSPQKEMNKVFSFLGIGKSEVETEVARHETAEYKMGFFQYMRRRVYFFLVRLFYRLISFTVRAKIRAQGEEK